MTLRSVYVLDAIAAIISAVCLVIWQVSVLRRRTRLKAMASASATSSPLVVGVCSGKKLTHDVLRIFANKAVREDGRSIAIERATTGKDYDVLFVDIDHPCEDYAYTTQSGESRRRIGIRISPFARVKGGVESFERVIRLRDKTAVFSEFGAVQAREPEYAPLPLLILACAMAIGFIALLVIAVITGL